MVPATSSKIATWKGIKFPIKVDLCIRPDVIMESWGDGYEYQMKLNTDDYLKYGIGRSHRRLGSVDSHPFYDFTIGMFPEANYEYKSKEIDAFLLTYDNPFYGSYPCICCRLPYDKIQGICHICYKAIDKILHDKYHVSNRLSKEDWQEVLRRSNIMREWCDKDTKKGKQNTFILSWEEIDKNGIKHAKDEYDRQYFPEDASHWPGFYLGNYKWDKMEHLLKQCILPKLDEDGIVISESQ